MRLCKDIRKKSINVLIMRFKQAFKAPQERGCQAAYTPCQVICKKMIGVGVGRRERVFQSMWGDGLVSGRSCVRKDVTSLNRQRRVRTKLLAEHWAPNFCLEGTHVLGLSKSHGQGRCQGVAVSIFEQQNSDPSSVRFFS